MDDSSVIDSFFNHYDSKLYCMIITNAEIILEFNIVNSRFNNSIYCLICIKTSHDCINMCYSTKSFLFVTFIVSCACKYMSI